MNKILAVILAVMIAALCFIAYMRIDFGFADGFKNKIKNYFGANSLLSGIKKGDSDKDSGKKENKTDFSVFSKKDGPAKITSFYGQFSITYPENTSYGHWEITVKTRLGKTYCKISALDYGYGDDIDEEVEVDQEIFDKLEKIVDGYHLEKFDGTENHTDGMADEYGGELNIEYSNGKKIKCFDNEALPFPIKAAEDFIDLVSQVLSEQGISIGI